MTRGIALAGLASLILSGASAATVAVQPQTRHQTILGWGATLAPLQVPQALRDEILDAAVDDLGLTRLGIEPPSGNRAHTVAWERDNDNGDPDIINWAALNTAALDQAATFWAKPFKERVERNKDPFSLYVNPSFFDAGSSGPMPSWMANSPGEVNEFALSLILRLRDKHGLTPDGYVLCNEAGNGNPFYLDRMKPLLRSLGARLEALKLPTRIQFPEANSPDGTWNFIGPIANEADLWTHIGLVTYHYSTSANQRASVYALAKAKGIPVAQTACTEAGADPLYLDLVAGWVSIWQVSALADWGDAPSKACCLSINSNRTSFVRTPEYWKLRQVMHYVRPGAVRVEAKSDDDAVRALAFVRDGRTTLVLLTTGPPREGRAVTVTGLPAGQYGLCRAVATRPFWELGVRTVGGDGKLELDLPRDAAVTLYPYPGGNLPPTVIEWRAEPSFLTAPQGAATLIASATDPELDPIAYAWAVASKPAAATVALETPQAARTRATGLSAPGDYVFALTVGDPAHKIVRKVRLTVFDGNQPPVPVDVHNRSPVDVSLPQTATELRGGARDLEGDPLAFKWSVAAQPQGAEAKLETPDKPQCKATSLAVAGDYVFKLEVSDPTHTIAENLRVTVRPQNKPPVIGEIVAEPKSPVVPGTTVRLSATTSDPDGDTLTHWWVCHSAPKGSSPAIEKPGAASTTVTGLTVEGDYAFTLTVIDRGEPVKSYPTIQVRKK